jgi:AraC-like DNA-binding protein
MTASAFCYRHVHTTPTPVTACNLRPLRERVTTRYQAEYAAGWTVEQIATRHHTTPEHVRTLLDTGQKEQQP